MQQNFLVIFKKIQVEGEVMCNSLLMVAHGVILTCDLVYNRCDNWDMHRAKVANLHLNKKQFNDCHEFRLS